MQAKQAGPDFPGLRQAKPAAERLGPLADAVAPSPPAGRPVPPSAALPLRAVPAPQQPGGGPMARQEPGREPEGLRHRLQPAGQSTGWKWRVALTWGPFSAGLSPVAGPPVPPSHARLFLSSKPIPAKRQEPQDRRVPARLPAPRRRLQLHAAAPPLLPGKLNLTPAQPFPVGFPAPPEQP